MIENRTARSFPRSVLDRMCRPVYALPVDLFRILAGLLSCVYFVAAFLEVNDISGPCGLVDHTLSLELFPYTKWSLFQGEVSAGILKAVFLGAVLISGILSVGYRPTLCAVVLYVLAVSTYRLNFMVLYVDDAVFHWILLWLILLPVGHTVTWKEWRREGRTVVDRWIRRRVPGLAVRCFLVNLALVYAASGLWKLTSPMWLEGTALYVILKLPIAWMPDLWGGGSLAWLKVASYVALAAEPLFVLLLVLRPGRPLKWMVVALLIVFHGGIIATLKIPYANLACLAGVVLWCRHEIMAWSGTRTRPEGKGCITGRGVVAAVVTCVLGLQAILDFAKPQWRYDDWELARPVSPQQGWLDDVHYGVYAVLWAGGLAQSYRLLDWVDSRNYDLEYEVRERKQYGHWEEVDSERLFPLSMRSILLQSYLHGIVWRKFPSEMEAELRKGLRQRYAARYCRGRPKADLLVEVEVRIFRVTVEESRLEEDHSPLMRFTCQAGRAHLQEAR